jgi:hypothetical protein
MECRNANLQVGCYTDPVTQIQTQVFIHAIDDFNGKPQLRIIDLAGDVVAGADATNTKIGDCKCAIVHSSVFRTQESLTLPAGLTLVTVRNKGAGSVFVSGKELCPPTTAPSTPCGNCTGEEVVFDAGCGVFAHGISINVDGCVEISISWSPNALLDMTDSDGDGMPDWLEELNPCLALPAPDVTVYDVDGTTPVGKAYSFASPCFDVGIEDLSGAITHYAASTPLLNKVYVPRTDLSGTRTHYLLAI